MSRSNEDYWRSREETQRRKNITDEKRYNAEIRKIYSATLSNIEKEINGFYAKYAAKEGISVAEAKKRASQIDIDAYAKKAEKYVASKDLSDQANAEMRLYNLAMKVSRLELLQAEIGLSLVEGFDELEQLIGKRLDERAIDELRRQAGILGNTINDNEELAHAIVNASFHNATYSDRIWMYQDMLRDELDKELRTGLLQGKNPKEIARHFRKLFGASRSDAERLLRTEMARVQTEAQKQSFERYGIDSYEFIALGVGACPICSGLNGKIFKVKEMQVGRNAPPIHPNCRCSTAGHVERDGSAEETNQRMQMEENNRKKSGLLALSRIYVNHDDSLYQRILKVKPIRNYEDFGVHGSANSIFYESTNGQWIQYSAEEFAEMLRNDPSYHGGNIRLLSCGTGQKQGGFAQQLADELEVRVMAPSQTLWVDEDGEMFISDSEVLADMWYNHERVNESGKWLIFRGRSRNKK